jgi:hypothetical protein
MMIVEVMRCADHLVGQSIICADLLSARIIKGEMSNKTSGIGHIHEKRSDFQHLLSGRGWHLLIRQFFSRFVLAHPAW